MPTLDLRHLHILITGGCGAIGQIVVRALAEQGARVTVNDLLAPEQAQALLAPLGDPQRIGYVQADVTQPEAVTALFDACEQQWGLPQVVLCHAGLVDAYPVEAYPLEQFDHLLDVNLRAAFIVAQTAVQRWLAVGMTGQLIFTTSWVEDVPWPEITPYTVSKAGLKAMTRGFARELASKGIRANAIAPGIVAVGLAKRQWDSDPSYRARAGKAIPLGYMQPPESIAHAFVFLCSPLADYMTGSVLLVDGGASLYPMD